MASISPTMRPITLEYRVTCIIVRNRGPEYMFLAAFIAPMMPVFDLETMKLVRLTCRTFAKIVTVGAMHAVARSFGRSENSNVMKCNSLIGWRYMRVVAGQYTTEQVLLRIGDEQGACDWHCSILEPLGHVAHINACKIMDHVEVFYRMPTLIFNDRAVRDLLSTWPLRHDSSHRRYRAKHVLDPHKYPSVVYMPSHDGAVQVQHRCRRYVTDAAYSDTAYSQSPLGRHYYLGADISTTTDRRYNIMNTAAMYKYSYRMPNLSLDHC